jgi:NADH-ubiquinone oxidoreductase chain 2
MLLISLLTIITLRTLPVLNKNLNEIILPKFTTPFLESRMNHIFYIRVTAIVLILTALVSGQFIGFSELDNGYSIYNGYFQINQITIYTEIFILLLGVLILLSWPGVPSINFTYSENLNKNDLYNNNEIVNLINYYQNFLDKSKDYSLIILFNIFGALLLISSFNLISLYIGIELQSFALYILATLYKESRIVTAAGLKYFILGALATCFILLGFAFIYAFTGLTNLDSIYCLISTLDLSVDISQFNLGIALVFIGLLFKIGAAPLHNWAPDVYGDSPTIVTVWLSVLPKLSIFILLLDIYLHLDNIENYLIFFNPIMDNIINISLGVEFLSNSILDYINLLLVNNNYTNSIAGYNNYELTDINNNYLKSLVDSSLITYYQENFANIINTDIFNFDKSAKNTTLNNLLFISSLLSLIIGTVLGLAQSQIKRLLA